MSMTLDEYQKEASRTANIDPRAISSRLEKEPQLVRLLNFSMGAAGEAGELVDEIKKIVFHGHRFDAQKLLKELGDLQWYVSQIAEALGRPLSTVAEMNIEKLRTRYPAGFTEEASKERVDVEKPLIPTFCEEVDCLTVITHGWNDFSIIDEKGKEIIVCPKHYEKWKDKQNGDPI